MNDARPLVVVVEDDASMRRALQRLLHLSGFDALLFDSAEAFVSTKVSRLPYCFVLDVQLPGLSGPRFYEQLGDQRPPALFISSDENPEIRSEVARVGGRQLLTKPFVAKDFLDAILQAAAQGSVP
jgi:FixJ family two-component response regulator